MVTASVDWRARFLCAPRPRPSVDSNYFGICLRASRPENYVRLGTLLTFVPACWPFEDDEILRQHTNLLYYPKGHRFDPNRSCSFGCKGPAALYSHGELMNHPASGGCLYVSDADRATPTEHIASERQTALFTVHGNLPSAPCTAICPLHRLIYSSSQPRLSWGGAHGRSPHLPDADRTRAFCPFHLRLMSAWFPYGQGSDLSALFALRPSSARGAYGKPWNVRDCAIWLVGIGRPFHWLYFPGHDESRYCTACCSDVHAIMCHRR